MEFLHRFLRPPPFAMSGSPAPIPDQEALHQEFFGALKALGGSAGNGKMRELLGWDEATYEALKASLLASGQPARAGDGAVR
jgi:hypothetical protein